METNNAQNVLELGSWQGRDRTFFANARRASFYILRNRVLLTYSLFWKRIMWKPLSQID